jgi:transcriptional regulator with XRE-family HTH domain
MLTNKRQNQNRVNKIILALKQARINRGITRYQLSKDTGLSDSSISNIEQLKQNPTLSTLMEMSVSINFDLPKALKENYPDLPEDAENASGNTGGEEDETLGLSPTFFLITDALKSMSEEKLRVVYSVIKGLNEK